MSGSKQSKPRDSLAIVLMVFVWFAATAWARPLLLPDEGRYVGVAWEMLRSGNWMTPTLNGLPFFHKPPLFYWITAASLSLLGPNEWAGRFASILGATFGSCLTYFFVQHWRGERVARFALVILAAQPLFFIGAQFANLDMLVAGCITATVVLAAHAALNSERGLPYRAVLVGAYAVAAMGILAKGLIGVVIPGLIIALWLLLQGQWRQLLRLVSPLGLGVFLIIAAPWFITMQWHFDEFSFYFFIVQHFKRFAEGGFNNVQPFWFYPAILGVAFSPWIIWIYRSLSHSRADEHANESLHILMVVWFCVVVVFFSIPASKLLGYVLPAVPPLAYFVADGYLSALQPPKARHLYWWASAGLSVAAGLAVVMWLSANELQSTREMAKTIRSQGERGDAVFMLDHYYYDLPFYARLSKPVRIVGEWSMPVASKRDNWQKEVSDAAQFAPAQAQSYLIGKDAFYSMLCQNNVSLVIGSDASRNLFPVLESAHVEFKKGDTRLWRVDLAQPEIVRVLQCEKRPSAG